MASFSVMTFLSSVLSCTDRHGLELVCHQAICVISEIETILDPLIVGTRTPIAFDKYHFLQPPGVQLPLHILS